jgi:hypothetical protein
MQYPNPSESEKKLQIRRLCAVLVLPAALAVSTAACTTPAASPPTTTRPVLGPPPRQSFVAGVDYTTRPNPVLNGDDLIIKAPGVAKFWGQLSWCGDSSGEGVGPTGTPVPFNTAVCFQGRVGSWPDMPAQVSETIATVNGPHADLLAQEVRDETLGGQPICLIFRLPGQLERC